MKTNYQLDNPIWHALNSTHNKFALGEQTMLRYPADILPFMAFEHSDESPLTKIESQMGTNEKAFIVGKLPAIPTNWSVFSKLECLQMICHQPINFIKKEDYDIVQLQPENADEMVEFINGIQPGYFERGTPSLGNYYGIRVNGKLIAMAGERLKMTGYTEISAVCTDPAFTGKGLAQYLITQLCNEIRQRDEVPFLHVVDTNTRAIRLYEFLGFEKRTTIPFWLVGLQN
ncbi:GNAT family N-acetyltransferase [Pedobacter sp. PAMC26386]|nr:GNAT family N-acetyltransferase [Pedobacter sp. PAMC26386]